MRGNPWGHFQSLSILSGVIKFRRGNNYWHASLGKGARHKCLRPLSFPWSPTCLLQEPMFSLIPRLLERQQLPAGASARLGCNISKSTLPSNPKPNKQKQKPMESCNKEDTFISHHESLWLSSEFKWSREPSLTTPSLCYASFAFSPSCYYVSLQYLGDGQFFFSFTGEKP